MGDPLKIVSQTLPQENIPVEDHPIVPIAEPPVSVETPVVQNTSQIVESSNVPKLQTNIPTTTPAPVVTSPLPISEPINTPNQPISAFIEPKPVITTKTSLTNNDSTPQANLSKGWKKILLLLLALLVLIIAIVISVYLIKNNTPQSENIVSAPVETVVSLPGGFILKNFEGRLYNLSFKYTSELGIASSTTSKAIYPSDPGVNGDCNLEDITFSNDRNLTIEIASGHCEGGAAPSSDFSKLSSEDGKSFFMQIKTLDAKLFPGMSTITVSGGIDSTNTFIAGITGVHIDAIRVKDPDKYKKYIEDIISTLKIELSPLKSSDFDSQSSI